MSYVRLYLTSDGKIIPTSEENVVLDANGETNKRLEVYNLEGQQNSGDELTPNLIEPGNGSVENLK